MLKTFYTVSISKNHIREIRGEPTYMETVVVSQSQNKDMPLAQRVNSYLRAEGPNLAPFVVKESAAEAELDEYLLERAEAQLRSAQANVNAIRKRLEARIPERVQAQA